MLPTVPLSHIKPHWHLWGTPGSQSPKVLTEIFYIFKILTEFWNNLSFLYFFLFPGSLLYNKLQQPSSPGILGSHRINRVKTHQARDHTAGPWKAVLCFSGQVANRNSQGGGSQCLLQGHTALLCPPSTRFHILKVLPPPNRTTHRWPCLHHVDISGHVDLPGLGVLSLWDYCTENNNVNWNELYDSFCFKKFRLSNFSMATR